MNDQWQTHRFYAALDWASDHHDVLVVDGSGAIQDEFRFPHSALGWAEFEKRMQPFAGCPLALETSSGPAVDQLLQRGWSLYPVNPKAAQRYRERKVPSGTKSDRHDTWSLAEALRTDGHAWRILVVQDEATATLRALCRDEIGLIEERTQLVNQLRAALAEYYPVALEAFEDWTSPAAWALIQNFPTPGQLARAGRRRWEKFLHANRLWRPETAPRRLELFAQAEALPASRPVVTAKSLLAQSLVRMLTVLEAQLAEYRRQIQATFAAHPDHDIFGSLPGAGEKLAPRLAAELGSCRDVFPDADSLSCFGGVSPVAYQSGRVNLARIRRACNRVLRATLHLWADCSRKRCEWAKAYYDAKRDGGFTHASALRCLAKRWVSILWRLWHDHCPYDEATHLRNVAAGQTRRDATSKRMPSTLPATV